MGQGKFVPLLLLLAGALLTSACDRRSTGEPRVPGGTSEGTPRPEDGAPLPDAGVAGSEVAVTNARRIHLEIRAADGSFSRRGEVEEGQVLSIHDDAVGLGFRPALVTLDGVAEEVVRLEILEVAAASEVPPQSPVFARLFVPVGGSGTVIPPDGEGLFEVWVTEITAPRAPS